MQWRTPSSVRRHHRRTHDLPDLRLGGGTTEQEPPCGHSRAPETTPTSSPATSDRQPRPRAVRHHLDGFEHRFVGIHRPDGMSLAASSCLTCTMRESSGRPCARGRPASVAPDSMPLHVVLFELRSRRTPGNVIRLCANTGATLHLVQPLGFRLDARAVRDPASITTNWPRSASMRTSGPAGVAGGRRGKTAIRRAGTR